MHIELDRGACIGAGQCALTAPDVFDQDEDGLVTLLADPAEQREDVHDAAALCPALAITVSS